MMTRCEEERERQRERIKEVLDHQKGHGQAWYVAS
jgi:uncharacterized protein (UPF0335 family)